MTRRDTRRCTHEDPSTGKACTFSRTADDDDVRALSIEVPSSATTNNDMAWMIGRYFEAEHMEVKSGDVCSVCKVGSRRLRLSYDMSKWITRDRMWKMRRWCTQGERSWTSQMSLQTTPQVLAINMLIFSGDGKTKQKITAEIKEQYSVSELLKTTSEHVGGHERYHLKAIVLHTGETPRAGESIVWAAARCNAFETTTHVANAGHYSAVVAGDQGDGAWFHIDDATVTRVKFPKKIGPNVDEAYLKRSRTAIQKASTWSCSLCVCVCAAHRLGCELTGGRRTSCCSSCPAATVGWTLRRQLIPREAQHRAQTAPSPETRLPVVQQGQQR